MSLLTFPTSYAVVEPNPESGQLELTQGWVQAFTIFNASLEGEYLRNRATTVKSSKTANMFTPNISAVYIAYAEVVATDTLTFPRKLFGFLDIKDTTGAITQSVRCNGVKEVTITNIQNGETVTGTLTTGE